MYSGTIKTSRGYRFAVSIRVLRPIHLIVHPGYNVGQVNAYINPSSLIVGVRNLTAGRPLDTGDSFGAYVSLFWRLPGGMKTGIQSYRYFTAKQNFGQNGAVVPAGGALILPAGSDSGWGMQGLTLAQLTKIGKLTYERPPDYVELWTESSDSFDGSWDTCPNQGVVVVFSASHRLIKPNPALCELLYNPNPV